MVACMREEKNCKENFNREIWKKIIGAKYKIIASDSTRVQNWQFNTSLNAICNFIKHTHTQTHTHTYGDRDSAVV